MASIDLGKKNDLIDTTIKDLLTGEDENIIKQSLGIQLDNNQELASRIYDQARRESGIDEKVFEPKEQNTDILHRQVKEIIATSVRRIENGNDPETVINEAEDRMLKMKLTKSSIDKAIQKIFDFFDYDKKSGESNDIMMKEGEDIIPLPRLDIGYDELRNLNLKEDEDEDLLPNIDRPLITEKNRIRAEKYENMDEDEKKEFERKIYNTNGKLVAETEKLEDFIRQVKLCALTLPPAISKLKIEDFLIRYLQRVTEKFNNIYVFGWEVQRNTEFYKSFDEILKMNNEIEGSLFIIRDIKTFNIYAGELLKGIPRNYYIVLLNGIIKKDDLVTLDNIKNNSDNTYLWPGFADMIVNFNFNKDYSFITGNHAEAYQKSILQKYDKPAIGMKESYSDIESKKELWYAGRQVLNSDFSLDSTGRQLESYTKPGININEAIKRSPKFRNMIISIFANADSRIFVKLPSGKHGLEAFMYIYEKLKKTPIKPIVILREEAFEIKRAAVESIPLMGPCLVITDYIITDVLVPKNIDKIFIAGGGEYHDMETILDIAKAENYTIDKYPRSIEIVNFITTLEGNFTMSIDDYDYDDFSDLVTKYGGNLQKIKSASINITIEGDKLMVRKPDF